MGLRIKIALLAFLIVISFTAISDAAWEGPTEIISGGWGTEIGQFGINYGDTIDQFPDMIVISTTGRILIGDSINKRIQVFNANGTFGNLIIPKGFPASYPPVIQWPLSLFICGDSSIYTRRNEYLQIYGVNGDLLQNFTTIRGGIASIDQQCNFYTYNPSTKTYSLYSPTGQLIRTTTEMPLELGKVTEKKTGQKREVKRGEVEGAEYTYTVQYPDLVNSNTVKTYIFTADREYTRFFRDSNDNIYGINPGGVWKYNNRGELVATLILPKNEYGAPQTIGADVRRPLIAQYGEPVIAPNGDVYTWKRTPTAYSIIKWRWR